MSVNLDLYLYKPPMVYAGQKWKMEGDTLIRTFTVLPEYKDCFDGKCKRGNCRGCDAFFPVSDEYNGFPEPRKCKGCYRIVMSPDILCKECIDKKETKMPEKAALSNKTVFCRCPCLIM